MFKLYTSQTDTLCSTQLALSLSAGLNIPSAYTIVPQSTPYVTKISLYHILSILIICKCRAYYMIHYIEVRRRPECS